MFRRTKGAGKAFLLLLALLGCTAKKSPVEPVVLLGTGEEYAVYQTLVSDTNYCRAKTVVLLDSTQAWDFSYAAPYWRNQMPLLFEETYQNYASVNQKSIPMCRISCPGRTCVFISMERMVDWQRLYPDAGGAVTVSRIGFNPAGNQALLYWSVYRAPKAAHGSMILLQKDAGQWKIEQDLMIWIS